MNKVQSIKDIERSAMEGNADAQYLMGYAYTYGDDYYGRELAKKEGFIGLVKQDHAKAYLYYLSAAEQDHTGAQVRIGWYFISPRGDEVKGQNINEGLAWWRKAAEQGDITAQCVLGSVLLGIFNGRCRDRVEGFHWLAQAARQGDEDAIRYLNSYVDIKGPEPPQC